MYYDVILPKPLSYERHSSYYCYNVVKCGKRDPRPQRALAFVLTLIVLRGGEEGGSVIAVAHIRRVIHYMKMCIYS